jgi:protein-S-isoprenylcysteine O-methyltransferase Ste14
VVVVASGFVLSAWAMGHNPYFEGTVRIQTEVGHRVIEDGPYRYLRHPGYLGILLWALGTPLVLGPLGRRRRPRRRRLDLLATALEDATLRRELPGYDAFTPRTRARLLPGLW